MIINNKKLGFTLIELLVVISVISLLASVIISSLNSARSKARDAQKREELHQIANAMELHYDKYGVYTLFGCGDPNNIGYFGYEDGGLYRKALSRCLEEEGFLAPSPVNQGNYSYGGYIYWGCDNWQSYSVSANLENPTANDIAHIQTVCHAFGADGVYSYFGKNFAVP